MSDAQGFCAGGWMDGWSSRVIAAAIEVHRLKGAGLLESIYERCLLRELELRGIWEYVKQNGLGRQNGVIDSSSLETPRVAEGRAEAVPQAPRSPAPTPRIATRLESFGTSRSV